MKPRFPGNRHGVVPGDCVFESGAWCSGLEQRACEAGRSASSARRPSVVERRAIKEGPHILRVARID